MFALSLTTTLLLLLGDFSPYVRSHTTKDPSSHCLWWSEPTITFSQSGTGNPATGARSLEAVTTSFATWQVAMAQCGSATLTEGPRANSRRIGVAEYGPNINVVLFRLATCAKKAPANSPCWKDGTCGNLFDCWDHATGLLGVTTVSYNTQTGEMLDADIELNSATNTFTMVDSPTCVVTPTQNCVAIDIQNTVTHEVGHLMGLDHTQLEESTMNANASMGDTNKRALDPGTRSFVCEVYTKGLAPKDCFIEPASDVLGQAESPKTGCSATGERPPSWVSILAAAAVMALVRRRTARIAALVGAMVAPAASATSMFALDLEALTRSSDAVARARVRRVEARWTADHARILTEVDLEILETWKGTLERAVQVTQPGGAVGPVGQRVNGVASFQVGEDVVVFLEARGPGYTVTGFFQGKFQVEQRGETLVAVQQSTPASLVDPYTGQTVAQKSLAFPVDELRRRVTSFPRPAQRGEGQGEGQNLTSPEVDEAHVLRTGK